MKFQNVLYSIYCFGEPLYDANVKFETQMVKPELRFDLDLYK